jgi:heptosyltransferase III
MYELACVINGRNLGDAIIQSRSIRRLIEGEFAERILIWTRPESAAAYSELPRVEIVTSPFPVGTNRSFGLPQLREFLRVAARIRRLKPQIALDFFGDARERLFGLAILTPRHVAIRWDKNHPYRRTLGFTVPQRSSPSAPIPSSVISVYEAHRLFVDSLLGRSATSVTIARPTRPVRQVIATIGLHPFASQECKHWPDENWLELCSCLLARHKEIRVFGAPTDRDRIVEIFRPLLKDISVIAEALPSFLKEVGAVDLLIGLDSLAVHAADRAGVPTIMLTGANHPRMWPPPLATALGQSGGCSRYPCYNNPSCIGNAHEYACIRSVGVAQVVEIIDRFTRESGD